MSNELEDMFGKITNEIFEKAGVTKEDFPEEWEECSRILSMQMARSSALFGLSNKRVELFEAQKEALVDDMKKIKAKKTH